MGFFDLNTSPQDSNLLNQQLLALGANLMAAGAPSTDPRSGNFGYAMGQGLSGMMQARQNALMEMAAVQKLKEQERKRKASEEFLKMLGGTTSTGTARTPSVEYQVFNDRPDMIPMLPATSTGDIRPAPVAGGGQTPLAAMMSPDMTRTIGYMESMEPGAGAAALMQHNMQLQREQATMKKQEEQNRLIMEREEARRLEEQAQKTRDEGAEISADITSILAQPGQPQTWTPEGELNPQYTQALETLGSKNAIKAYWADQNRPDKVSLLATLLREQKQYKPGSPEWNAYQERIRKESTHQPAATASAVVNAGGKSVAEKTGDLLERSKSRAEDALLQLDIGNRMEKALASGKVVAGPLATYRLYGRQLGETMGVTGGSNEEILVNTRNVVKGLAQYALASRGMLKGQGQISDFEGKTLEKAESGNIEDMTVPELKAIVGLANKAARARYKEHERMLGIAKGKPEMADYVPFYDVPDYGGVYNQAPTTAPASGAKPSGKRPLSDFER